MGVLAGLVALVGTTSCSSDGGEPSAGGAASPPAETTGPSTGTDVVTTAPGSVLELGDTATVAWRPSTEVEGLLGLSVDAVREADPRDFDGLAAAGAGEDTRPYYVDVTVGNVGDTDLGGLAVPLYLHDTSDALGPPWGFEEPFGPCRSRPLPEAFAPGDSMRTCLVYLARAGAAYDEMALVTTPDQEPITWSGDPRQAR